MKNLLVGILMLTAHLLSSQSAMFTIESPDSLGFELAVNGLSVSDSIIYNYSTAAQSSQDIQLDLLVDLDSTVYISSTIQVEDMKHLTLHLMSVGPGVTLVEFSTVTRSQPLNTEDANVVSDLDSMATDSIPPKVLPAGCTHEMSAIALANLLGQLEEQFMDRQRINIIENLTRDKCLDVGQLRQMATFIEFEDSRLELCQRLYPQVIDKDQYASLEDLFILSAHREKFAEFLNGRAN